MVWNNKSFLLWELTSIFMQTMLVNSFVFTTNMVAMQSTYSVYVIPWCQSRSQKTSSSWSSGWLPEETLEIKKYTYIYFDWLPSDGFCKKFSILESPGDQLLAKEPEDSWYETNMLCCMTDLQTVDYSLQKADHML